MKAAFKRKHILFSLLWLVLGLGLFLLWYFTDDGILNRYVRQGILIAAAICLILLVNSLRKALPEVVQQVMKGPLGKVFRYIARQTSKLTAALRRIFGLPERYYLQGRDESHYVYDTEHGKFGRRVHQMKNAMRWKDLSENADRIRFLYIKNLLRRRKKGAELPLSDTPYQLSRRLAAVGDEAELFRLYDHARYSGGRMIITDAQVEKVEKAVK